MVSAGVLLLAVLSLVGLTYANALDAPFVWDDYNLVLDNPALLDPGGALDSFFAPFWPTTHGARERGYFRPLVVLSLALDHALYGENPAGFHLTNVLLHLLCVSLVFGLVRAWGGGDVPAALASGLWGLQPRLTESVTWISGRTDLLAAVFTLLALRLWSSTSARRRWLSAVCLFVGLLGKEVAVAALPAILAYEWRSRGGEAGAFRRVVAKAAPLLLALVAYLSARAFALPAAVAADEIGGLRPVLVLTTVTTYVEMLLRPLRPQTQIGLVYVIQFPRSAIGAVLGLALAAFVVLAARRARPGTFAAIGLAAGGLLPVLHLLPLAVNVVAADRFLYLPTAGVAIAGALASARLPRRPALALALTLAALLPAFAWHTRLRNETWGDEIQFWVDAVRTTPLPNLLPRTKLAEVLLRTGRAADAVRLVATIPFQSRDLRPFPVRRPRRLDEAHVHALELFGTPSVALRIAYLATTAAGRVEGELLEAAAEIQGLRFDEARRRLLGLKGRQSDPRVAYLLELAGKAAANLGRLEDEKAGLPAGTFAERRAVIVTPLRGEVARAAWRDVLRSPGATRGSVLFGASYLVANGSGGALRSAAPPLRERLTRDELSGLAEQAARRYAEDILLAPLLTELEQAMERAIAATPDGR